MNIKIKDVNVNYIQYGKGKNLVLLHGWGQNIEMMKFLGDKLDGYKITILDLPGFGESSEPDTSWTINDYSEFLKTFLNKLNIINPVIIAHSFGGRITIRFASENDVDKIVLFGSPCVRKEQELSLSVKLYKKLKSVNFLKPLSEFMRKKIGSADYNNASSIMRGVLVNVVNQDLSEYAKKIEAPTLLIWGNNDEAAPLEDAEKLEKLLKDGALITLNGTHYAYLENLNHVVKILKEFI